MKKEPFVSIVICTHNRVESLNKLALKSISKLRYINYEVIIIDDASTDRTEETIKKYQNKMTNLKYIKNNKSRGLCFVRNLGVKNSKGEIIAFTDDDCIVDKNWLKELVKPYLKDKEIMVVGGTTYIRNTKKIFIQGWISGCNMSFRKEVFNRFLFDTNLKYSHLHDETDLIYRIKNKNLKMHITNKAIIKHFILPAKYRKNKMIGQYLNYIYYQTKPIPLKFYYKNLINNLIKFLCKKNQDNKIFLFLSPELKKLTNLFFKKKLRGQIHRILFILFIEIPIKTTIKNRIEERKYKKNTAIN